MLTIIAKNPIHYQVGLFKYCSQLFDTDVVFLDRAGFDSLVDEEFNCNVKWDIPLFDGYNFKFIRNYGFGNGFFSRINPSLFKIIIKSRGYILFQSYDNLSTLIGIIFSFALRKKVLLRAEATNRTVFKINGKFKSLLKYIFIKFISLFIHKFLYTCKGNYDYFKHYSIDTNKLIEFRTAVDNDRFRSFYETNKHLNEDFRYEFKIEPDDFVIIFPSRLTSNKRPILFLQAVKLLERTNIHVVFVGDGPLRGEVEKYCSKYRIKYTITGFVNQSIISEYYLISDLLVLISGFDNSPKVLNEAMNFGIPLIVTERAGTAYDLVRNCNGSLIKLDTPDEISTEIYKYYNFTESQIDNIRKCSYEIIDEWSFDYQSRVLNDLIRGYYNDGYKKLL